MKKLLFFIILLSTTSIYSDSLKDYKLQFESVKNGVEYLSLDYLDDNSLKSEYKLSKRFNNGYVTYLLGDYSVATMIFYDIVSRREFKNEPVYIEALFYLAESYRKLENYLGAKEYYRRVLDYHDKKFYQKALKYYLELSRKTNDFTGTDKYMNDLETSNEVVTDSTYYVKGKNLFAQKRYDEAALNFLKVRPGEYRIRALYYAAVCYTAKAKEFEYEFDDVRNKYLKNERKALALSSKLIDAEDFYKKAKDEFEKQKALYKETRRKYIQFNKWYYSLKRVGKKLKKQKEEFDNKHKDAKESFEKAKEEYEKRKAEYEDLRDKDLKIKKELKELTNKRDAAKKDYGDRVKIYDKALKLFKKLLKERSINKFDRDIKDQALLSIGRINYTIDRVQDAINAYQDIKRNSKYYDLSLYESAWAYVKAKEPKKALYAVDLLIDVLPDSDIIPDALLLRANLYNEMDEFEKASEAYGYIEDRYSMVSEELQKIIDDNEDLEAYFSNIISTDLNSFSASKFLPREALKYVRAEKLVKKAQKIVDSINDTKKYLNDSVNILESLLKLLSDRNSINALFPKTEEVRRDLNAYANKLLTIDYRLNNYFYKNYKDRKNKKLKLLRLKILKLWDLLKKTPKSKSEYEKRKAMLEREYTRLNKKAYRTKMYIKNLKKEIKAMEILFSENIKTYHYAKEWQDVFYEKITLKKKNLALLEKALDQTVKNIENWHAGINSVDKANIADKKLKENLLKLFAREREFYKNMSQYSDAEYLIEQISLYRDKISKLLANLDNIVYKKAMVIKSEILREKKELDEYKKDVDKYVTKSKNLTTKIALASFKTVNKKFHNLILNADLGELEVIWKGKDKLSKQIQSYYSQERERLKILNSEFKEILEENK